MTVPHTKHPNDRLFSDTHTVTPPRTPAQRARTANGHPPPPSPPIPRPPAHSTARSPPPARWLSAPALRSALSPPMPPAVPASRDVSAAVPSGWRGQTSSPMSRSRTRDRAHKPPRTPGRCPGCRTAPAEPGASRQPRPCGERESCSPDGRRAVPAHCRCPAAPSNSTARSNSPSILLSDAEAAGKPMRCMSARSWAAGNVGSIAPLPRPAPRPACRTQSARSAPAGPARRRTPSPGSR